MRVNAGGGRDTFILEAGIDTGGEPSPSPASPATTS
jgi:hypothetical protein